MRHIWIGLMFSMSVSAWGQPQESLDGTWKVTGTSGTDSFRESELVINGKSGTWTVYLGGRRGSAQAICMRGVSPIIVHSATSEELVFTIDRTGAAAGCDNIEYRMRRVDAKTFVGTFNTGATSVTATKQ